MKKKIRNSNQYVFSFMEGEDIETIFTFDYWPETYTTWYNSNNWYSTWNLNFSEVANNNITYGSYMPIYASTTFHTTGSTT